MDNFGIRNFGQLGIRTILELVKKEVESTCWWGMGWRGYVHFHYSKLVYSNLSVLLSLLTFVCTPRTTWQWRGITVCGVRGEWSARRLPYASKSLQNSGVNWPDQQNWVGRTTALAGSRACPVPCLAISGLGETGHLPACDFPRTQLEDKGLGWALF